MVNLIFLEGSKNQDWLIAIDLDFAEGDRRWRVDSNGVKFNETFKKGHWENIWEWLANKSWTKVTQQDAYKCYPELERAIENWKIDENGRIGIAKMQASITPAHGSRFFVHREWINPEHDMWFVEVRSADTSTLVCHRKNGATEEVEVDLLNKDGDNSLKYVLRHYVEVLDPRLKEKTELVDQPANMVDAW